VTDGTGNRKDNPGDQEIKHIVDKKLRFNRVAKINKNMAYTIMDPPLAAVVPCDGDRHTSGCRSRPARVRGATPLDCSWKA
jgi:hypothetical protein